MHDNKPFRHKNIKKIFCEWTLRPSQAFHSVERKHPLSAPTFLCFDLPRAFDVRSASLKFNSWICLYARDSLCKIIVWSFRTLQGGNVYWTVQIARWPLLRERFSVMSVTLRLILDWGPERSVFIFVCAWLFLSESQKVIQPETAHHVSKTCFFKKELRETLTDFNKY